jgi:hypothetical protein
VASSSVVATIVLSIFVLSLTPVFRATAVVSLDTPTSGSDLLLVSSTEVISDIVKDAPSLLRDPALSHRHVFGFRLGVQVDEHETVDVAVDRLRSSTMVLRSAENPQWIEISVNSTSARLSADFANLLAARFVKYLTTLDPGNEAIAETHEIEAEVEQQMVSWRTDTQAMAELFARQAALNRELRDMTQSVEMHVGELELMRRVKGGGWQLAGSQLRSPVLSGLVRELGQLHESRQELAARYGPQHRRMIAINEKLTRTELTFETRLAEHTHLLEGELAQAESEADRILDELKLTTDGIGLVQRRSQQTETRWRDLEAQRRQYEVHQPNSKFAGSISHASVPEIPVYPQTVKVLCIGFLISVGLFATILLLLEKARERG